MTETTLVELSPGDSGRIKSVFADGVLAQRLIDMGIYPGVNFNVIRYAPLFDPIEIEAEGTFVSLRREEAKFVGVSKSK